jgi:hypothetical protein
MRRRDFITLIGGAAVIWPFASTAQEAGRTYGLGILAPFRRKEPASLPFFNELQRRGFIEGQNLAIYYRDFGPHVDRISEYAAELIKEQVDVIWGVGGAAMRATSIRISCLLPSQVAAGEEIAAAIDLVQASGAAGLNVLASPMLFGSRQLIMNRVAALRLPAIYQWPDTAEEGGFVAYGPRFSKLYELLAQQAAKLLRGIKVADIPVEQPTKFELAINLKTAKALGLTIPESFLQRADEVIE